MRFHEPPHLPKTTMPCDRQADELQPFTADSEVDYLVDGLLLSQKIKNQLEKTGPDKILTQRRIIAFLTLIVGKDFSRCKGYSVPYTRFGMLEQVKYSVELANLEQVRGVTLGDAESSIC